MVKVLFILNYSKLYVIIIIIHNTEHPDNTENTLHVLIHWFLTTTLILQINRMRHQNVKCAQDIINYLFNEWMNKGSLNSQTPKQITNRKYLVLHTLLQRVQQLLHKILV